MADSTLKRHRSTPRESAGAVPGLSPKQADFVREYLVDLNATQAAIRAGYSAKTAHSQGQRLLKHVGVSRAVNAAKLARSERVEVKADDVLRELLLIAQSDIGEAFDEHGGLKPLKDIPPIVRRAIAAVETDELKEDGVSMGVVRKVKFWPKTTALDLLGKHLKLFTEVRELRFSDMSDEQLEARYQAITAPEAEP